MLVVVGGHAHGIGKTSVVAGLIRALPEWNWTAIKIEQTGRGVCSSEGTACGCEPSELEHPFAISEEAAAGPTDTGRYLAAGARRAFWVRTVAGQLGNAIPAIRKTIASSENAIVESNSILQFFRPLVYLAVMDFSNPDFKPSSLRFLDRADALVVVDSGFTVPLWKNVSRGLWDKKRQFLVKPRRYFSAEVADFVKKRLVAGAPSGAR